MSRIMLMSLVMLTTMPGYALNSAENKGPVMSTHSIGFGDFLQMILGLLVVLGVIFFMAWLVRRMSHVPARMQGALKVLCGLSIGQRERIVLIQVGEQQILIGVAPGQIRTLHVLPESVRVEGSSSELSPHNFAEKLQAMLKGKIS